MERAFEYDIVVEQGATFNLPIEIVDVVNGVETPTDITGWTAKMQARATFDSDETLFDLSSENGDITIGDETGLINASISAEVTTTFPSKWCGVYDLKIITDGGEVDRLIRGKCFVSPEVTRDEVIP